MSDLNIKPTHKSIKTYYAELEKYAQLGEENEGTVRAAFQNLLQHYCHQSDFTLLCKKTRSVRSDNEGSGQTALNRRIRPDGEVVDAFGLPHGYWEAKDTQDDLLTEASKKFAAGYPSKNIVVQSPTQGTSLSGWAAAARCGYHRSEKPRPYATDLLRVSGGEHLWHGMRSEFRETCQNSAKSWQHSSKQNVKQNTQKGTT